MPACLLAACLPKASRPGSAGLKYKGARAKCSNRQTDRRREGENRSEQRGHTLPTNPKHYFEWPAPDVGTVSTTVTTKCELPPRRRQMALVDIHIYTFGQFYRPRPCTLRVTNLVGDAQKCKKYFGVCKVPLWPQLVKGGGKRVQSTLGYVVGAGNLRTSI